MVLSVIYWTRGFQLALHTKRPVRTNDEFKCLSLRSTRTTRSLRVNGPAKPTEPYCMQLHLAQTRLIRLTYP